MKYAYTLLYVQDVAATLTFYEQAFGFTRKFLTPEKDYGELNTGGTTLGFVSESLANSNLPDGFIPVQKGGKPFGVELAFTSETLAEDFQRALQAGATEAAPIQTKPWGQQVGYLRDLNGFLIEMCTPMQG